MLLDAQKSLILKKEILEDTFISYNSFREVDPFNKSNCLEGYICTRESELYGSILFEKINDVKVEPKIIFCTPKIRYPFSRRFDGLNWNFPKAKRIECYTKLDGTNVFAYTYLYDNREFLTFKTRLNPVLRNGKFAPFEDLWKEILKKYPNILRLNRINKCNISYELYGSRNKHLIHYEVDLDVAVLFGVKENGDFLPPSCLETLDVPSANLNRVIDKQYVEHYKQAQLEMDSRIRDIRDGYVGDEGEVWYLLDEKGKWNLFKCKPYTIEQIHWAGGSGISKNSILATCYNVFENYDELNFENVKVLLEEEFSGREIMANKDLILDCIQTVISEMQFKAKIVNEYRERK